MSEKKAGLLFNEYMKWLIRLTCIPLHPIDKTDAAVLNSPQVKGVYINNKSELIMSKRSNYHGNFSCCNCDMHYAVYTDGSHYSSYAHL